MSPGLGYSAADVYELIPEVFGTFLPKVANPPFRPGVRDGKKGAAVSLSANFKLARFLRRQKIRKRKLAERARFELAGALRPHTLSKRAH